MRGDGRSKGREVTAAGSVRWGVLSTALIARHHMIPALHEADQCELRAIASRTPDLARIVAEDHLIPVVHFSYGDLLADPDIDAVYIPLPNHLHARWIRRAVDAGKHVLCEKPLAVTAAGAGEAFDAAEAAGRVLVEGLMWRHHPQTTLARRLVTYGAIGELRSVRAALSVSVPPGDIRRTASLGGGSMYDLGCYCVSAVRLFAGEPQAVCAEAVWGSAANGEQDVDLRLAATLRIVDPDSGRVRLGQFDTSLESQRRDELELVGSSGTLRVPDPWLGRGDHVELIREGHTERVLTRDAGGPRTVDTAGLDLEAIRRSAGAAAVYRLEMERVTASITGVMTGEFGRTDAIRQATVLEAVRRSATQRLRVELRE